jgi:CRISPR-associated protein Csm5
MSEYVEKRALKLKLLTPVHISDGYEGELIPTEYVVTNSGKLHKMDLSKLISCLPQDRVDSLNEYLENEDIIGIRDFVKSLWEEKNAIFSDVIEYSMGAGDLIDYYKNLHEESKTSQLMVTPFIRTAKRTFIPGSSVKGAIRTAIISELLAEKGIHYELNTTKLDKKAQMLEANTLNYSNRNRQRRLKIDVAKDPFKALKISDAFLANDKSMIRRVWVVRKTKARQFDVVTMEKMQIFGEFIEKGSEANIEIRLDTRYFRNTRSIGRRISFEQVAKSCKAFYKRVLNHEKAVFFNNFDKQVGQSRISDLYDKFLECNANKNSFLLRLGKHSGRNSLSFNLLNKRGVEPSSRKLIVENGEYWPVGWVCITEQ